MEKQALLEKVNSLLNYIKSFFDEYREKWAYDKENVLIDLLSDIVNDISNNSIPKSLYDRISKLIDTLAIEKLQKQQQLYGNIQDFEKYKKQSDDIIINCNFVSKTYYLLKAIGFTNSNVVLIGANGSGKTTFANSIRNHLEKTENGIVIPAQKILIFPTYSVVPTYHSANADYEKNQKEILDDKQTYEANKSEDFPYSLSKRYGEELKILLSALLGERNAKRNRYCSSLHDGDVVNIQDFQSTLDEVIIIWNNLIEHRKLLCDDSGNLTINYLTRGKVKSYPAYRMSDGEREIFYVVGRILLAKENSLVVVDEPELHLHKSILNKLWDTLEQKRNDCMFIYLTHDIDFASSRIAKKCWLKSYSSEIIEDWEVEPITNNEIPEALLMKLLGSRKKILFCEGRYNSMDCQIFELLFPNYTIAPVASCKDVIDFTKAFNKINDKYSEAYGIIDRDYRTKEQLEVLAKERIFSYNVAEIENLFLLEDFLIGFADYKKENCCIDNVKKEVVELLNKNISQQASFYVAQKINFCFRESFVKNGNSIEDVRNNYSSFISQIQLNEWYNDRIEELRTIVNANDYSTAILVYNNKGLRSVVEKELGMSSFNKKAIEYLKASEDAKIVLRKVFPKELQQLDA